MKPILTREQRRLKYASTINDEALPEITPPDHELQYIDISNVDSSGSIHEIADYRFENAPSRARRIVRDGDVIISTVRTYLQAIAPIIRPPDNLIVSTGFAVVRPLEGILNAGYCKYALREPRFLWEVEGRSVGVSYPAINASDLGDIRIELPPLATQQRIAAYLDAETAQIDALIVEKAHMLALLAEKRAALVSRAVTRGLDPAAPLKPSGLAWLGEIPAHWAVMRIKHLAEIQYGLSQPPSYHPIGIPFLRATNVSRGRIFKEGLVFVNEDELSLSRVIRLRAGDIIVVRSGAYTGDSALVTEEWVGSVAGYDLVMRVDHKANPAFVSFALLCPYILNAQLDPLRLRAAQPHLNAEELGSVWLLLPPIHEQENIVSEISHELAHIDRMLEEINTSVSLLKERRSALITAAVTGQLSALDMAESQRGEFYAY